MVKTETKIEPESGLPKSSLHIFVIHLWMQRRSKCSATCSRDRRETGTASSADLIDVNERPYWKVS